LAILCRKAESKGFEFKLSMAQFNQVELELWGCVCGKFGPRAMEKKIEQLENWPVPTSDQALSSFLCFVNYLREYMDPEWIKHEATLSPFRKKGTDFGTFQKDAKYEFAFREIRKMLSKAAILHHPDYVAASVPWESGRPFEIFVDASDYGWCAALCQRPTPHKAPKIIGMIAKAFSDTQLRWSAMERELYALWQGVVGFERLIRGFKVYVYMDHKNNLYTEALLDNRRVAKKMVNWALELQHFNIVRVWIRGEANILADAPSRAPWESKLMEHLPLADLPIRELIQKMYRSPADFEEAISTVAKKRGLKPDWEPLDGPTEQQLLTDLPEAYVTPDFGHTPDFGSTCASTKGRLSKGKEIGRALLRNHVDLGAFFSERVSRSADAEATGYLGPGQVLKGMDELWPQWPMWAVGSDDSKEEESVRATTGRGPVVASSHDPVPMNREDVPHIMELQHDERGHYYVVRWPKPVLFDNGERKTSLWFSVGRYGSEPAAQKAAWRYFSDRYRGLYTLDEELDEGQVVSRRDRIGGILNPAEEDGKCYHGDRDHRFTHWSSMGKPLHRKFKVVGWNVRHDTLEDPSDFCSHHELKGADGQGNSIYECLGHDWAAIMQSRAPDDIVWPREGYTADVSGIETAADNRKVSDWWDYYPAEKRFVRVHEVPRTDLMWGFDGTDPSWDEEDAPGETVELSRRRVTAMHFVDGTFHLQDDHNMFLAGKESKHLESVSRKPKLWTGVTSFWAKGTEPIPQVLLEAYYKPRAKADLIEVLEGGDINRDTIPICKLTAIGLETEAIIDCQRVCQELGLLYIAVACRNANVSVQAALHQSKTHSPELWYNGQKAASVERLSEKFETTDQGLLCRRVYDASDGEMQ